jgi:hypothetical protein
MLPRIITPIEDEYNQKFKGNPATFFFPYDDKGEGAFSQMLKHAIETNIPLNEQNMIDFYGKEAYMEQKTYIETWYEMEIGWK